MVTNTSYARVLALIVASAMLMAQLNGAVVAIAQLSERAHRFV
jgi:vacuolar-type H+-ATPase subunit I/STV1